MVRAAYTTEAIAAIVKNRKTAPPRYDRWSRNWGGKLAGIWFCFGEYDAVGISEPPDNVSPAAFAFAVSQGGKVKALKTTPLMTGDEAVKAMKKAAGAGYRAPGS